MIRKLLTVTGLTSNSVASDNFAVTS